MKTFIILFSFMIYLNFSGCDKSVNPGNNITGSTVQIDGCSSLRSAELTDSCFNYTFNQNLLVEFCVDGNCCPDANRFKSEYLVRNDTINVIVADTARNLCRCNCTYKLHSEFQNLPLNSYLFRVLKKDTIDILLYSVNVIKN